MESLCNSLQVSASHPPTCKQSKKYSLIEGKVDTSMWECFLIMKQTNNIDIKPSKELETAWISSLLLSLGGICEEKREKGSLILSNFWKEA